MFLKNQNQVCLDVHVAKREFVPVFDQQHQGQNQNVVTVVQSAQLAKMAMHRRVAVGQSRQPGQIDHVASHENHPILSVHRAQRALQ
jgi:hypothetical protein